MRIVRLENGEFALEIPLQEEYIKIKRYEPYGQPIDKATITTIKEDMYVEWELSERHNNIQELLQSIQENRNSTQSLIHSVRDCCKYEIYTEQDILDYQNFIEWQDDGEDDEIEPNKIYYDSRVINGMDKDFTSSVLIEYDTSNFHEILHFPFWIEVHTDTERALSCICFYHNFVNLLRGNIRFILNTEGKYALLEACRVFAALNDDKLNNNKNIVQKTFTICLDSFKIAQAFNLKPYEYKIDEPPGENSYRISPVHKGDEIIIDEIRSPKIFNLYSLTMVRCVFNSTVKLIKETGMDTALSQNIVFRRCSFKEGVFIAKMCIEKKITFDNCTFDKRTFDNFSRNYCAYFDDTVFFERASFQQSIFKNDTSFVSSIFKSKAFFSLATFEKEASFRETVFEDNTYFDDTDFKDVAEFKLGEFHKNAHFYKTKFKRTSKEAATIQDIPCFFQTIFDGSINLTGTNLFDFEFEQFVSIINSSDKDKAQTSEEFRNVFKNIKDGLIRGSNLLDASRFHKMELYAKELELEYKRKEEVKNSKCSDMFKFLLSNGKDFIDEIQLYCYRLTSDHHTNLLMILNNVIFLIALFGIAKCAIENKYINISETLVSVIFIIISILFLLRPKFTLGESCCKCSKIIKNCFAIILTYIIPIALVGYMLFNYYVLSVCFLCFIVISLVLYIIFYAKIIKIMALPFIYFMESRTYTVFIAYVITTIMLFSNPTSILPILGKLIENKSGEMCLFVIGNVKLLCCGGASSTPETLNLIYMLFLFLLLWSLQKTARKNTIVPS
ncbi:MAG: hypothetical protein HDT11_02215 [Helicobacter sp.]|nr:hypothetical protein [Helicobacter sp.]